MHVQAFSAAFAQMIKKKKKVLLIKASHTYVAVSVVGKESRRMHAGERRSW